MKFLSGLLSNIDLLVTKGQTQRYSLLGEHQFNFKQETTVQIKVEKSGDIVIEWRHHQMRPIWCIHGENQINSSAYYVFTQSAGMGH